MGTWNMCTPARVFSKSFISNFIFSSGPSHITYSFYLFYRGYLDIQLEEDLEHLKIMDSLEEGNDHRTMLLKRSGRFDSSACLIVPNEYRIPPNPENCM